MQPSNSPLPSEGEAVLVQFEHILVPCRIVHGPTPAHLDRLCVEPLQGVGRTWVGADQIGAPWINPTPEILRQAREYREMGRDFPLTGIGNLFELLEGK